MILNLNDDQYLENPGVEAIKTSVKNLSPEQFAVLSRTDEEYVQTCHNEDGTFQLEYRDGSQDNHYAAKLENISVQDIQKAFIAYVESPESWSKAWKWEKVEFDDDFEGDLTDHNAYLLNGEEYKKIPVGSEKEPVVAEGGMCPECNVGAGYFHDPACGLEECPRCHDLLSECECE